MARNGVTYFDVDKAASRLVAKGCNPTVDTVREALGTGSKSTIAPLLKRWKSDNERVTTEAEHGLPTDLLEAVKLVHERIQASAQRSMEQAQLSHDAVQQKLSNAVQALQAELGQVRQNYQSATHALAEAQQRFQQLASEHQAQAVELAALRSDKNGLEQRLLDRAAELQSLVQQHELIRRQHEHYQEAVALQRQEERQAFEQRIMPLEQALKESQRLVTAQEMELQKFRHLAELQSEEFVQLRASSQSWEQAAGILRSERDQLSYQLKTFNERQQEWESALKKAQHDLEQTRTALAVRETEQRVLIERANRLEAQCEGLRLEMLTAVQEKALLQGQLRQWQNSLSKSSSTDHNVP